MTELQTERAIYWQQMSAVEYAAARRAFERDWPYEATGHQRVAAEQSALARAYLAGTAGIDAVLI